VWWLSSSLELPSALVARHELWMAAVSQPWGAQQLEVAFEISAPLRPRGLEALVVSAAARRDRVAASGPAWRWSPAKASVRSRSGLEQPARVLFALLMHQAPCLQGNQAHASPDHVCATSRRQMRVAQRSSARQSRPSRPPHRCCRSHPRPSHNGSSGGCSTTCSS